MGRCEIRNTKPWTVASLVAPASFCYALSSAHVNNNLLLIKNSLGIETSQAQWIINIELLIVIVTATMCGKLGERFSTGKVMLVGSFLFSFFNICFVFKGLETSFAGVLALRVGSSIGLGLVLPSSMPLGSQLAKPGKLPLVIALNSMMSPVGCIISALCAGPIAQASTWRYMFVMTGVVALLYFFWLLIKIPMKVPTKQIKLDWIGVALLAVGMSGFITGVSGISDSFMPKWACCVVIAVCLCIIAFFIYYNMRLSRNPIFQVELFNTSTMQFEVFSLLTNIMSFTATFFVPYIQMSLHGYTPTQSGMFMSITNIGSIVFSPVGNILFKKMTLQRSILLLEVIYGLLELFNGFHVRYFYNQAVFVIINFIAVGTYLSAIICVSNANFAATPFKYTNSLGVLNQMMMNSGHSLGVSIAVAVNQLSMPEGEKRPVTAESAFNVYMVAVGFACCSIILQFFTGNFKFERGKIGFSEKRCVQTKSFEENLINDPEMIVQENFEQEEEFNKMEKLLIMFNGI